MERDKPCSWVGRLHINQSVSVLPQTIYRFNAVSIKIPTSFLENVIQRFKWSCKGHSIARTVLKKNKVGVLATPTLTSYKLRCCGGLARDRKIGKCKGQKGREQCPAKKRLLVQKRGSHTEKTSTLTAKDLGSGAR